MTAAPESTEWPIGKLLTWTTGYFTTHQIDEPRLSAELLLAHVLACSRMALYTRYDEIAPAEKIRAFKELVKRRREREPVAYLTGKAWFFSLEFSVSPAVLIPRPDTETLVEQAVSILRGGPPNANLLDLCTGSGCVALAVIKNVPDARAVATDISDPALQIAKNNAAAIGLAERVDFFSGDLYAALGDAPPRRFDVITANPPYIPSQAIDTLMPEVSRFEPRLALDGGSDGLQLIGRIINDSPHYLAAEGYLLLETGCDQTEQAAELIAATGQFSPARIVTDSAGHRRCVIARRLNLGVSA